MTDLIDPKPSLSDVLDRRRNQTRNEMKVTDAFEHQQAVVDLETLILHEDDLSDTDVAMMEALSAATEAYEGVTFPIEAKPLAPMRDSSLPELPHLAPNPNAHIFDRPLRRLPRFITESAQRQLGEDESDE